MKLKPILVIFAAVCIIVLGAMLPQLVALRQDGQSEGQIQFSSVEGVELEFTQSDISRSETLAILAHSRDVVEIPPELANLSQEKLEQIARATARNYYEAGILLSDPGEDRLIHSQPLLYYGMNGQSNVLWLVTYGDEGTFHLFTFIVDDRTGAVCSAEYLDGTSEYEPDRMEAVLGGFCRAYLTGLGDEFSGWSVEELTKSAKSPQDKSYLATELGWSDPLYGENRITFFVNRSGFYTYFG